ncbi:MAG TPA: NUDIX domain-containing protein [Solirubrobacteraceae bacterium]|nr:NUDIX domain-containing protein [Solirubrobacteraceae bacterium]
MIARLSVPMRRLVYRVGYVVLKVASLLVRPHTRGVKCVVARGDELLLVRHTYGPKQWDLAGGFCRRGEEFAVCARREVAEELGVHIVGLTDIGEELRGFYGRHETLRLFRVDVIDRELAIDRGEIAEARWWRRDELPVPRSPLIDVALAREALREAPDAAPRASAR